MLHAEPTKKSRFRTAIQEYKLYYRVQRSQLRSQPILPIEDGRLPLAARGGLQLAIARGRHIFIF